MALTPAAPGPGNQLVAVTPSDSTVYTPPLTHLYVGASGNVAVMAVGNTAAVTILSVPSGTVLDLVIVQKVMATNTTATEIVGAF